MTHLLPRQVGGRAPPLAPPPLRCGGPDRTTSNPLMDGWGDSLETPFGHKFGRRVRRKGVFSVSWTSKRVKGTDHGPPPQGWPPGLRQMGAPRWVRAGARRGGAGPGAGGFPAAVVLLRALRGLGTAGRHGAPTSSPAADGRWGHVREGKTRAPGAGDGAARRLLVLGQLPRRRPRSRSAPGTAAPAASPRGAGTPQASGGSGRASTPTVSRAERAPRTAHGQGLDVAPRPSGFPRRRREAVFRCR